MAGEAIAAADELAKAQKNANDAAACDVEVRWPSGVIQVVSGISVDQLQTIREPLNAP